MVIVLSDKQNVYCDHYHDITGSDVNSRTTVIRGSHIFPFYLCVFAVFWSCITSTEGKHAGYFSVE